jgi:hypothetical protein
MEWNGKKKDRSFWVEWACKIGWIRSIGRAVGGESFPCRPSPDLHVFVVSGQQNTAQAQAHHSVLILLSIPDLDLQKSNMEMQPRREHWQRWGTSIPHHLNGWSTSKVDLTIRYGGHSLCLDGGVDYR